MSKKWIVVANRVKALVFATRPFVAVMTLENSLGKEKNRAMTNDRPGSAQAGFSKMSRPHAMTGEKDPHEDAAIQFARTICRYLEYESIAHHFDQLEIVVEPRMMGYIRGFLGKPLAEKVVWVSKDLGHLTAHEIARMLKIPEAISGAQRI